MIDQTEARLSTHEAVCAERYEGIQFRLGRMEKMFVGSAGAIIMLLIGILSQIITKG